jgi:hypothetical protein
MRPGERLHLDHSVARSRGGTDTLDNVQVTHQLCNLRKGRGQPTHRLGCLPVSHTGPFVIVDSAILEGAPIRAVSYLKPEHEWDSGFCLFSTEPDEPVERTELVCVGCLLDDHPDIARGLELARRRGEAIRDRGEWTTDSFRGGGS